jgi:hypothetical protein
MILLALRVHQAGPPFSKDSSAVIRPGKTRDFGEDIGLPVLHDGLDLGKNQQLLKSRREADFLYCGIVGGFLTNLKEG